MTNFKRWLNSLKPEDLVIDNDNIRFVPANHRYHDLGVCGFSHRGFLGASPHADKDAPLRVIGRIAPMDANSTACRNFRVMQKRKLPFKLWRLAVLHGVHSARDRLGGVFERVAYKSTVQVKRA